MFRGRARSTASSARPSRASLFIYQHVSLKNYIRFLCFSSSTRARVHLRNLPCACAARASRALACKFRCGEIAHQDQPPRDPKRVKYELIKFDMQTSPQKQRPVFNPRNYEKCYVKRSVGDPIAILIKTPSSRKC